MKYSCNRLKKQKEMRKKVGIVKQGKDFTKETGVTKLVRSVLLPMRTSVRHGRSFVAADCETERDGGCSLFWGAGVLLPQMR